MKPPKSTVASPCINVCSIDMDSGFCRGCFRNLEEVTDWILYTDDQKRAVLEQLRVRREQNKGGSAY